MWFITTDNIFSNKILPIHSKLGQRSSIKTTLIIMCYLFLHS